MNHKSIIAKEGLPFIIPLALFTATAFFWGPLWSAILLGILTAFVVWFFRNPERKTPKDPKLVISPADGRVIRVEDVQEDGLIHGRYQKISIFMNVFSVHVNRIPYSGTIGAVRYYKGKFLSANLDKASLENERNAVLIRTDDGRDILMIQVAGLVARRIVCWLQEGMRVNKGERFGLIRFGSRVEVFLPMKASVLIRVGDRVRAGETPIGGLS